MMTKQVNIREIALGILMEITEEEAYSHIVLREVLEKYQYLEKRDRAFISRVVEGTLEHMIQLDYIIEQFSNVPVYNMKPLIRNLLRMSAEIHGQRTGFGSMQRGGKNCTAERFLQSEGLCQRSTAKHGTPLEPGKISG